MTTHQLRTNSEDSIGIQYPNEMPENSADLRDVRVQFQLANRSLAELEEKFFGVCGTVNAYRQRLNNSRTALATVNDNYSACYNSLLTEQQRFRDCSQAYENVYEQNGQMENEMHELATTNVALRQEVQRAHSIVEASHAQNVELEALLDGLVLSDSMTEGVSGQEAIQARITALENRLKIEGKRLEERLGASDRLVTAEKETQKSESSGENCSPAKGKQSAFTKESNNGGERKQHWFKGSQKKESRRPTRLTLVSN